jgi:predicted dehydrogenase
MKFLIAGLGSAGRRHLRNLVALGERDIVLLRTHHATLPEEDLAGLAVEEDLAHALEKHRPDAVIVANPTALHLEIAIPAAEAGCCVLLEKPVAESLEQLPALESALRRGGGRLLVGFQFRFHPALIRAREIIRSGQLGTVLTAHTHWGEYLPDWHPWEDYRVGYAARADLGGGVIRTITHPLDYLRYLIGEVTALWSFNGHISPLELDVEDTAEIGLRFAEGAIGGLHLNYFQRPPVHRLEIAGTGGTLHWDNADGILRLHRASATFGTVTAQDPETLAEIFPPPAGFERNDLFLAEMKHFIDVVRGEADPVCTLPDGTRTLELALAAQRSAAEKRLVEWGELPELRPDETVG